MGKNILDPPITLLDTTGATLEETTAQVMAWITQAISNQRSAKPHVSSWLKADR